MRSILPPPIPLGWGDCAHARRTHEIQKTRNIRSEYMKRRNQWSIHLPPVPPFSVFVSLGNAASFASPLFSSAPLTACVCEGRMGSSDHCNTWSISGRIKWATRREQYVASLNAGLNFTQATRAVGVSRRTGKVWRNEHMRATGRNEKPSADWYRSPVNQPAKLHDATSTRPNAF